MLPKGNDACNDCQVTLSSDRGLLKPNAPQSIAASAASQAGGALTAANAVAVCSAEAMGPKAPANPATLCTTPVGVDAVVAWYVVAWVCCWMMMMML